MTAASGSSRCSTDRDGPFILVAEELSASVAVQLDWDRVVAFVIAAGSWTYHTAILARSLGIPAVVALRDVTTMIEPGVRVVVDGSSGEVLVNPPVELRTEMMADEPTVRQSAAVTRGVPRITTADGRVVRLEANIERPEDVEAARSNGATGIGLYRSEYLVAGRAVEAVSEDVQLDAYRRVLESMRGLPVTIRTFDLGETHRVLATDVRPRVPPVPRGIQAIGLSGQRRELLYRQLRALVRAARFGELRIMFPFVDRLEELVEARALLNEVWERVTCRGEALPSVAMGAMIEVPAAALIPGPPGA